MAEKLQLPNTQRTLEPLLAVCDNPTPEQAAKMLSRWGLTPEAFKAEVQAKLDRLKKDPVEQLIARVGQE